MPDFLSIPGNIRQQYMPFTIMGPGRRQLFSFKDVNEDYPGVPAKKQIYPFSRWLSDLITSDSSIMYTHKPGSTEKVKYEEFLHEIPSFQIREYVPDAKLTQTFKWFSYFKKGFDAGLQNIDGKSFDFAQMKDAIKDVMEKISETMKKLTSGDAPLLQQVVGGLAHFYQDKGYNIGPDDGYAVLFLPFILYYRLTTTHTNNIYELPFSMQNEIMKSDGTYGWTSTQSDFGLIDKGIGNVANSAIAKALLGNTVKVNMMPSFQPTGDAHGETITINIDLINDSDEAAASNFLMCHTLFGNNRWLQYGFVQAGASLYDIKLPGANRYFMCSGQFSCKGKGAFRTPSASVLNKLIGFVHKEDIRTFAKDVLGKVDSELGQQMVQSRAEDIVKGIAENGADAIPPVVQTQKDARFIGSAFSLAYQYGGKVFSAAKTAAQSVSTTIPSWFSANSRMEGALAAARSGNQDDFASAAKANQYKEDTQKLAKAQSTIKEYEEKLAAEETAENELNNYQKGTPEYERARERYLAARRAREAIQDDCKAAEELLGGDFVKRVEEQKAALLEKYKGQAKSEIQSYIEKAEVGPEDLKKIIKIPDVYSLTLTFQSLLPDNFNNYLYGFRAANLDPIENYAMGTVDELGVFEKLVQQLEEAIAGG